MNWIKLSEKKPEIGQWCLVCGHVYKDDYERGAGVYRDGFYSDDWDSELITHWMPFPNPPTDVEL